MKTLLLNFNQVWIHPFISFFYETQEKRKKKQDAWNEAIKDRQKDLALELRSEGALPIIGAREFHMRH